MKAVPSCFLIKSPPEGAPKVEVTFIRRRRYGRIASLSFSSCSEIQRDGARYNTCRQKRPVHVMHHHEWTALISHQWTALQCIHDLHQSVHNIQHSYQDAWHRRTPSYSTSTSHMFLPRLPLPCPQMHRLPPAHLPLVLQVTKLLCPSFSRGKSEGG